jgi:hypothetical protein
MLHKLHLIRYDLQFVQSCERSFHSRRCNDGCIESSYVRSRLFGLWGLHIISVLCAVVMFQCFGVPEPVRPLPGFDPRTFVKLNYFFRNVLLSFPAVHASRPARFMKMWLIRMNESEWMSEGGKKYLFFACAVIWIEARMEMARSRRWRHSIPSQHQ